MALEPRASSQLLIFHLCVTQPGSKGHRGLCACQQHYWCTQDAIFACSHEGCWLAQHESILCVVSKKEHSPLLSSSHFNNVFWQSNFKYLDDPWFWIMWFIQTLCYSYKLKIECICVKQTVFCCYVHCFLKIARNLLLKKECIR